MPVHLDILKNAGDFHKDVNLMYESSENRQLVLITYLLNQLWDFGQPHKYTQSNQGKPAFLYKGTFQITTD